MTKVLVHGKHETEWVTISKDEYDSMNRTIDVLTDKGSHGTDQKRQSEERYIP